MQREPDIILQMAADLGILPSHISLLTRTAPLRYKVFYIPKKSGGMREVAQPAREVKTIQRWLIRYLKDRLPIHEAATAYMTGTSIRANATAHRDSRHLLKLDFSNYFPSIVKHDIQTHLEHYCADFLGESAREIIAHTCCWMPRREYPLRLCIGAPTSPMLSNSLMYDFDRLLGDIANDEHVTYTRYADDITLSAAEPGKLDRYVEVVKQLLRDLAYPRIELNMAKVVRASRASKRVVTGLVLTPSGSISIGRDRKRLIRAMFHRKIHGRLSAEEAQALEGFVAFAENIEPGFRKRLEQSML
ncbi:retron St85 family RNA-directed DNA polymerase [Castellaniella sp. GW247-6E4]|uniref:retron St85 family RNA-directed DNA polymerase n=1 Tax=Castellaniella sp. GW247-6E4 TaxID=3140380 RepID=UPI003315BB68